jgi:hypothetical protein
VLEFLGTEIKQEKEIKWIQIGEKVVKLSSFAGDMILYVKDHKTSTTKLLDLIKSFDKIARCKNQHIKYIRLRKKPGNHSYSQ